MKLLFFNTHECPFCIHWKLPLLDLNAHKLPVGGRLSSIDVDKDIRHNILEKTTNSIYPAILILKKKRERKYKTIRYRTRLHMLVTGARDQLSNKTLINSLLRGEHDEQE